MTAPISASVSKTAMAKESAEARPPVWRGDPQQMDLFGGKLHTSQTNMPAWRELPRETRAALTSLMTQLIPGHSQASRTSSAMEAGHDF